MGWHDVTGSSFLEPLNYVIIQSMPGFTKNTKSGLEKCRHLLLYIALMTFDAALSVLPLLGAAARLK
jgi:hypothetical protein